MSFQVNVFLRKTPLFFSFYSTNQRRATNIKTLEDYQKVIARFREELENEPQAVQDELKRISETLKKDLFEINKTTQTTKSSGKLLITILYTLTIMIRGSFL